MTNRIGHRVIAISRIFLKDQWKFLPWWLLSKSEYNEIFRQIFAHCDVRVDRINESGRKKVFRGKKGFQHEHETKLESKTSLL